MKPWPEDHSVAHWAATTYTEPTYVYSAGSTRLLSPYLSLQPLLRRKTPSRLKFGSDGFTPATPPAVIINVKIWTSGKNGAEVLTGSIYLNKGLMQTVAHREHHSKLNHSALWVINAEGRWVTPGLVDLHSHIGAHSAPALQGASDGNSHKAPILPWPRSIDGLSTHNAAYNLTLSGGVTTAQILPGSANDIGSWTSVPHEASPNRRALDIVKDTRATTVKRSGAMTLIIYPTRVLSETSVSALFANSNGLELEFSNAYNEACKVKLVPDAHFIQQILIPRSLFPPRWGDLSRSRSFEEDLALFASNARKKREMYRGSEIAHRILAENGIPVVMRSDNLVLNSRYLLSKAQLAHYYGLDPTLTLSFVTTVPAAAAGVGLVAKSKKAMTQMLSFGIRTRCLWEHQSNGTQNSNVTAVYSISDSGNVVALYEQATEVGVTSSALPGVDVVINDKVIVCIGHGGSPCPKVFGVDSDLQGGVLAPGLMMFGSPLGLVEIRLEPSTADGDVRDPLTQEIPSILGTDENASIVRAVDGLQFPGRNSLQAFLLLVVSNMIHQHTIGWLIVVA
ncbi:hypothetical protein BDN72DRAFT_900509 [Pluteus cervinus]|uniref:Uncharacterized protein n=1 Tax=Pluteus cervinus TaxID=181527 RepID=A0ACD3AL98_9AGAR|nr:hypothetical protein BDN72DRAFT_900509 [Pluteus cervinus]